MQLSQGSEGETTGDTLTLHECVATNINESKIRINCACGATWTLSKKEYDAGLDHIEDHRRYANRPKTRVD